MKYVNYILDAEEPIKMGDQGSQANSDALSYIAGSAIRGAVISECVKAGMSVEELVKKTRFFDAYIVDGERNTMPIPLVYYADKHAIRENESRMQKEASAELTIRTCLTDVPKEGEQHVDSNGYALFEPNGCLVTVQVRKTANLHIRVGNTPAEKAMYRYEAIEEKQSFGGAIVCEDSETAEMYKDMIEGKVLYLGGSKGSGYGRCKVRKAEVLSYDQYLTGYGISRTNTDGTLVVYAMSNLLPNDEFGGIVGEISGEYLAGALGITEVKPVKSFVATGVSGGFNHMWRAGSVQRNYVKAGSVFVYTYRGELEDDAVLRLEEQGIGMRRQDGFGRVLINPDLDRTSRVMSDKARDVQMTEVSDEDREVLSLIGREIGEGRYQKAIEEMALKCAGENRKLVSTFSLAQISRLYGFLSELAAFDISDEIIKCRVKDFSDGVFKRTSVTGETEERTSKTVAAYRNSKITLPNGDGTTRQISMATLLEDLRDDTLPWGVVNVPKITFGQGDCTAAETSRKSKVRLLGATLYNLMRREGGKRR